MTAEGLEPSTYRSGVCRSTIELYRQLKLKNQWQFWKNKIEIQVFFIVVFTVIYNRKQFNFFVKSIMLFLKKESHESLSDWKVSRVDKFAKQSLLETELKSAVNPIWRWLFRIFLCLRFIDFNSSIWIFFFSGVVHSKHMSLLILLIDSFQL